MLTNFRGIHFLASMLTMILLASQVYAESASSHPNVLILYPDSAPAQLVAKSLATKIPGGRTSTSYSPGEVDLVITIGGNTYKDFRHKIQEPLLATYIFYNDFVQESAEQDRNTYALVLEPNPEELASKIKHQFDDDPIGYIYTKNLDPYRNALNKHLNIRAYQFDTSLSKTFTGIYRDAAIRGFYISENREIFDVPAIRETLKSLYTNRIPAITSNEYLKKSGAVISVYSPRKNATKEIIRLTQQLLRGSHTNKLNFVPSLTEFNKTSARSLNISIREEVSL